jgi:hypothetical protein
LENTIAVKKPRPAVTVWGRTCLQPYMGSVAFVNAAFEKVLRDEDFEVHPISLLGHHHRNQSKLEEWIPFQSASTSALASAKISKLDPEICIYDDSGLSILQPERINNGLNAVVMHGMCFNFQSWFSNGALDKLICFSPYWARAIRSVQVCQYLIHLLEDAPIKSLTEVVTVAMPYFTDQTSAEEGYSGAGNELSTFAYNALKSGGLVGHALSTGKVNPYAIISILNEIILISKIGRKDIWLIVSHADMSRYAKAAQDLGISSSVLDHLVPVRYIKNSEMLKVVRMSSFCLCYNEVPESFGIYATENVYNGCPVFTNGIGNLRYLLPESHGIYLIESPIHFSQCSTSFAATASFILEVISKKSLVKDDCDRGRNYIEKNYSYAAFRSDFREKLLGSQTAKTELKNLKFSLSPCIRHWEISSNLLLSDYKSVMLSSQEVSVLNAILEKPLSTILEELKKNSEFRQFVVSCMSSGIVTLKSEADDE